MDVLKRAAERLQNSAEEFEATDGLSICIGIDAWNEFFEVLGSELERMEQAGPVNQQILAEAVALLESHQKWLNKLPVPTAGATYQMMNVVGKAIDTLAGMGVTEATSSPPGWKLVPIEPTSKMIVAGSETDPQFFEHAQFVYRAMLAAAPEPEGGAK